MRQVSHQLEAEYGRELNVTNRACSGAVARNIIDGTVSDPRPVDRELKTEKYESKPRSTDSLMG